MPKKRIYTEGTQETRYQKAAAHNFYLSQNPQSHIVQNATVLPLKLAIDSSGKTTFLGGIIDNNDCFFEPSAHIHELDTATGSLKSGYKFNPQDVKHQSETVIYGGLLYEHFGHFLVESVSRLWYVLEHPEHNYPLVFVTEKSGTPCQQILDFFALIGINRKRLLFIQEPTCFDKIIVPEQSAVLSGYYTSPFILPYEKAAAAVTPQKFAKVYLSRRKFHGAVQLLGEEKLEKIFRANGYKVIYPERLSLKEQIAYIRGAKAVASVMGSASHLMLFAHPQTQSIVLERTEHINLEQILINQAKDLDWYSVCANMNYLPVGHEFSPLLMGLTESAAAFFADHGYKFAPQQVGKISNNDIRKFNRIWFARYSSPKHYPQLEGIDDIYASRIRKYCTTAFLSLRQHIFLKRTEGAYRVYSILGLKFKVLRNKESRMTDVKVISVVRDSEMYDKCVKNNPYFHDCELVVQDNRVENKGIAERYNEFLNRYDYTQPAWFVFCHEDWQPQEAVVNKLKNLPKDSIYGVIGVKFAGIKHKGGQDVAILHSCGKIRQCDKNGQRLISIGITPPKSGVEADTTDCQCLIVHSDLIKQTGLRFDENLKFDFYVEEFCINASENFGIKLKIIPLKCCHHSYGNVQQRFYDAVDYVRAKYPHPQHPYASTVNKTVIGLADGIPVMHYKKFGENFWFQKKATNSGNLLIKICKIPVFEKKLLPAINTNGFEGVVYTCIMGNYDNLVMHDYTNPIWKYVCFTNNKKLLKQKTYGKWEIQSARFKKLDNTKNARWHKTHPHILFPDCEKSLWIDANGNILSNYIFNKITETYSDLLIPLHFSRDDIYEECEEVIKCKKDSKRNCNRIKTFLQNNNMPRHYGLNETNVIYRRHNQPLIKKIMNEWWSFILNYSKRDQLSCSYVLWKNGIKIEDISIPNARFNEGNFIFINHIPHNKKHKTFQILGIKIKIKTR